MQPYIKNENSIENAEQLQEYIQPPEDMEKYLQFSNCIKCRLCLFACSTVATDTKFPGPQALAQAYRYNEDITRDNFTKKDCE